MGDENKPALSPLVATILLVAFSIGLGALVMTWGEEYVEARADFVQGTREVTESCDAISFNVIRVSDLPQVCIRGNTIEATVDNGPDKEIYDFHARVLGTETTYSDESTLTEPLRKLNAVKIMIKTPTIGTIKQVKLSPKVSVNNEIIFCKDHAVTLENIRPC